MARIETNYNVLMLIVEAEEVQSNTVTLPIELFGEYMNAIGESENLLIPVLCVHTVTATPAYIGAFMLSSFTPPNTLSFEKGDTTITVTRSL